ncbi:MAG: DUF1631 family protein [Gammaproteobacteria bacterium]|nr:DUF1631 family protein [Gammaproteobacteria bacterium]
MSDSKLGNVVLMDTHFQRSQRGETARLSTVLKQCRDLVVDRLSLALAKVMDQLDDALFDLADRSSNNEDQALYFETMREMRLRRAGIEEGFKRHFKEGVRSKVESLGRSGSSSSFLEATGMKLGLVEDDDFEETIAVTNMVQKIRAECRQTLYALERRLEHLLGLKELSSEQNPLGPEAICNAFKEACADLDVHVRVRLTILKLFERHVGAELCEIYESINDHLVAKGVLPEIRHEIKVPERHHRRAYPMPDAYSSPYSRAYAPPADGDPHGRRHADGLSATTGLEPPPEHRYEAPSVVVPSGAALLDALRLVMDVNYDAGPAAQRGTVELRVVDNLTRLQHAGDGALAPEFASLDVSGIHTGTVNVLRGLKSTPVTEGMGEIDVMMFDVVAMMFDYILDDGDIPAPIKALIGRLQIPVLKVAIIDKSFFARKFHPARKLLNTLAETAIGWSGDDDRNDLLYGKMEMLVMRVLDEFDDRIDVFAEVLAELEAFVEAEESGALANASTQADALQGQERLNLARRCARERVERCLASGPVRQLVSEFLSTHWKELLFVRCFEEGEDGPGWKLALETMEELVWSVAPKTLAEDRKHLTNLLPSLLRRLRDGMQQLGIPAELTGRFLGELKRLHIAAIRNVPPDDEPDATALPQSSREDSGESAPITAPADLAAMDEAGFEWSDGAELSVEELTLVQLAIERANEIIHGAAEARPECAGMGTTVVAAQFHEDRVTVAHVGDSRLYRLRGETFEQMTVDHSLRQQLVERGIYTAEEVREKVGNNVVTRAVGAETSVEVDTRELAVEQNDLYLLCSDGLSDMVDDGAIAGILLEHGDDLPTCARLLVERANACGGEDNISAVLVRVQDTAVAPGDDAEPLEMYGITDVGRKRSHNEDHIAVDVDNGIAIVADGMGGCNAGEVASEMAVKVVIEAMRAGSANVVGVTGAEREEIVVCSREARLNATTAAAKALLESSAAGIVIESLQQDIHFDEDVDDEYTLAVRELEVGNWVEFLHADGESTRARLTWVSPVTGRYLFTDRKGMKVADSTLHGLATELMRGSLALIDDVPLFDRVIGNIRDSLSADAR